MQVTGLVLQETFFLPCTRPHLLSSLIWIISWGRIRDVEKKHLTLFLVSQKKEQRESLKRENWERKFLINAPIREEEFVQSLFMLCVCACLVTSASLHPMGCSPPGSSVHGIFQARISEWVAFPSPGDLPHPGVEPASLVSPALAGGVFTVEPPGKPCFGPGVHRYPHGHHVSALSSHYTDGASEAQRCGKGDNRVRLGRGWPEGKPGGASASVLCSVPLSSLRMRPAGACIRAMTSWRSTKRHQDRGKKPRQVASWVLASMRPNALVPAF